MNTREVDLRRFKRLLHELGNPQNDYPKIHIAGTKGKGSTAAILASILHASGLKVGLYTSPHLVSVRERISVEGSDISKRDFASVLTRIEKCSHRLDGEPNLAFRTVFEHLTAAAFLYFSKRKVDIAIIETGLGGKLDSTVVIEPVLSILTSIGLDHTAILGDTIGEIATDKAHIIKRGIPSISAPQTEEARDCLKKQAVKVQSNLIFTEGRNEFKLNNQDSSGIQAFSNRSWLHNSLLELNLAGEFQLENTSVALTAIEQLNNLGFNISSTEVRQGLKSVRWNGRLQMIRQTPLILLDGSHNALATDVLLTSLEKLELPSKIDVIFAALKGKPVKEMLLKLGSIARKIYLTEISFPKAMPLEELETIATSLNLDFSSEPGLAKCIKDAKSIAGEEGVILITGSLYLVGEVLRIEKGLQPPPSDGRIDDAI